MISSRRLILFYFCAASVLISFNISALTAVIPAMARSLNVTANDAAGVIPYYMIPYGVCALLYAPLAARYTIKQLMIAACLLFALGHLISLSGNNLTIILLGRVVAGLGAAAVTPLALMTLGKIFEKDVRGRVIGMFFASSFLGAMLGLLLSGVAHWHWLYTVPVILGILLAIGFYFCPDEGMEANSGIKVNYLDAFNAGGLRRILLFIFFMSLFFHGVCKWYGVYLDKIYHYNQLTISSLIILTAIAAGLGQVIGGFITDKLGRRNACYIGTVLLGVSVAALFFQYSMPVLIAVLSLISLGWTIAHNGISTVLTDFPDAYRLELASLNSAVRFFSGGIGFYLSGSFIESNFSLTFLIIGCLMLSQIFFIHKIVPKGKEV